MKQIRVLACLKYFARFFSISPTCSIFCCWIKKIVLQGVYRRIFKELTSFFLNFFSTFLFTFETLLRHLIYLSSNPTLSTSLTSFNIQTSSTPSHGRYLFPATSLTIQILMKETKHIVITRVGLLGTTWTNKNKFSFKQIAQSSRVNFVFNITF